MLLDLGNEVHFHKPDSIALKQTSDYLTVLPSSSFPCGDNVSSAKQWLANHFPASERPGGYKTFS